MELILTCLAVAFAKCIEISIQAVKMVCMVKGERKLAACLGFVECVVWGLVVSSVITSLNSNYWLLFSYCLGYAIGLYLGSCIENKIALGTSCIQIMLTKEHSQDVEDFLRRRKHGFMTVDGRGAKEETSMITMVLPRKEVKSVMSKIRNLCDNKVFIVSSEVSKFSGGYGIKK